MNTWHRWHRMERGEDAAGVRWYLDGRPLHCGDALHLRLPAGAEVEVTFQVEPSLAPKPLLHLTTGREPYPVAGGAEVMADAGPACVLQPAGASWAAFDLRWPVESGPEEGLPW